MLGVKAAATRKSRNQDSTVKPKDVPGFSKWITSEVYIEEKITQSSLEQLALSMIENVEWINEAIEDILSVETPENGAEVDTGGDEGLEKGKNEPWKQEDKEAWKTQGHMKRDVLVVTEEKNDKKRDRLLETERERDIAKQSETQARRKEPYQKEKREEEKGTESEVQQETLQVNGDTSQHIIPQTADNSFLLLKSPKKIRNQSSSPIRRARNREVELVKDATSLVLEKTKWSNAEDTKPKEDGDSDADLSFELIRRDIRKSFAAKQKVTTEEDGGLAYQEEKDCEVEAQNKRKSPEEEIKELSKLISDGLFSDDSDSDLTVEFDKLEKIELSQIQRHNDYKSPIKFSEMPKIEPLTLESSRKRSSKKANITKSRSDRHMSTGVVAAAKVSPTVFNRKSTNYDNKSFDLKPLPSDIFATGNLSTDEPTIKLNRKFPRPIATHRESDNVSLEKVISEKISPNGPRDNNNGLMMRLMQPTEASRNKSKLSPVLSPHNKSAKLSRRSTPKRIVEHSDSGSKEASLAPVEFGTLKAPEDGRDLSSSISPVKRQVPLTKRSLKTSMNYDEIFKSGKDLESNIVSGLLFQSSKRLESKIPISAMNKSSMQAGQQPLKHLTVSNTHTTANLGSRSTRHPEPSSKQAASLKSTTEYNHSENILPAVIAPLENEDPAAADDGTEDNDWCSDQNLGKQLSIQRRINPTKIFGECPPRVDCEKLFGNKGNATMNIDWQPQDLLTRHERDQYKTSMGYL